MKLSVWIIFIFFVFFTISISTMMAGAEENKITMYQSRQNGKMIEVWTCLDSEGNPSCKKIYTFIDGKLIEMIE